MTQAPSSEHVDVLIVGAGLSGIGAAVHLQKEAPGKTYAILEARSASGGTWDLFRYPGVRSDSDMYTLGYIFRPWPGAKAIADGPSILEYIRDTAREEGVEQHIRYDSRVVRAEWSSADARWTVILESGDRLTCSSVVSMTPTAPANCPLVIVDDEPERLLVDGVFNRDYAVVQCTVFLAALLFVVINFFVDLIYGVLDPRIRAG